uniref:Uncharacterized protein n=1 Tax=Eutreptiella gymnastica TaxID=73025 RepID=A0A7S1IEB7_9EUGL
MSHCLYNQPSKYHLLLHALAVGVLGPAHLVSFKSPFFWWACVVWHRGSLIGQVRRSVKHVGGLLCRLKQAGNHEKTKDKNQTCHLILCKTLGGSERCAWK